MQTSQRAPRTFHLVTLLSLALGLSGAIACSDDAGGGDGDGDGDGDATFAFCAPADTCPPSVDGVDLTTAVSFRTEIYEMFRSSCGGGSGCHGHANAAAGLYFGNTTDATAILDDAGITALINQLKTSPSENAPGEFNVVASNWQSSWLMTKLDGCQADYGITCDDTSMYLAFSVCGTACGDGMPASLGDTSNPTPFPLTAAQRHKVRAWIAQGAEDN